MNKSQVKLISLNLAVLTVLMFVLPSFAASDVGKRSYDEAGKMLSAEASSFSEIVDYDPFFQRELARLEQTEPKEFESFSLMTLSLDEPYAITVGGTRFYSDETRFGSGWSYADGELSLDEYSGSSIYASGDLAVYSNGNVRITGQSGTYGSDAICVDGLLDLYVESGTLTAIGGSGTRMGGDAVRASELFCLLYGGKAKFTGGSASSGVYGGDAVYAYDVYVSGDRGNGVVFTATGGAGSTSNTEAVGGSGIYAYETYVSADSAIQGGNAYIPGPAVYYAGECSFGAANITLTGGRRNSNIYISAVVGSSSANDTWYYSTHTSKSTQYNQITLKIKQYNLLLDGNGGKRGGATSTSLRDYYPTYYDLSEYTFTRSGYEQVAWTDASGDLVPLNSTYLPTHQTWLDAEWERVVNGDILLLGLKGKFSDDLYWKRYSGYSSAVLPSYLSYYSDRENLLGWTTVISPKANADDILSSAWYAPNSTVMRDMNSVIKLYAQIQDEGNYVVYHGVKAQPLNGGNIVVQSVPTYSDLSMYAIDAEQYFTQPEGLDFGGWAREETAEASFDIGEKLLVVEGNPLHLYAKWEPKGTEYVGKDIHAWFDKNSGTLSIRTTETWQSRLENPERFFIALYDAKNKMKLCREHDGDDLFVVNYKGSTLPIIKVFAFNRYNRPAGKHAQLNLSNITP